MIIIPANTLSTGGYEVANSCRFDKASSPSLSKTSGTPTNALKWTFSAWVKISNIGNDTFLLDFNTDGNNRSQIGFQDTDKAIIVYEKVSGSTSQLLQTSAQFRDPSAWLNIVVSCDRTLGTDTERTKIYVNGTRVTSFSTADGGPNYPAQNTNGIINTAVSTLIGKYSQSTLFYDGYMCEVVFIDGTAYAASDFGEFDEDSPTIWKPKDPSGLTFGTNGFYLDFEDSSNLGNDANGGTDFTETNIVAADQATDTCTNNFATMNPLDNIGATTFSEGNNKLLWTATNKTNKSTIGVTAGKWYAECKAIDVNSGTSGTLIGVGGPEALASTYLNGAHISGWGYRVQTGNIQNSAGNEAYGDTWAEDDIIGVALDMDNGFVYMSKNGTFQDSGDPTSGSSGTNAANNQPSYGSAISGTEFFACSAYDTDSLAWNFGGCPSFAISSGNADADGYGNFEYAPPTGYYALCTKNLAEYGG